MSEDHDQDARLLIDAFIARHKEAFVLVGAGAYWQPADEHLNAMLQENLVSLDRFLRVRRGLGPSPRRRR